MNYLAHLYFSAPTPLAWSGSLMGDFVKGRVAAELPAELSRHIHLHRRLDTYTLQSPAFQRSRKRLDGRFRYARGILVDVFYDHFLARFWSHYSEQSLTEFSHQVYQGLNDCFPLLPAALQEQLPRMIEHDWLTSYQFEDVVKRVLSRLEVRLKNKFPLADGYVELDNYRSELEADFIDFMAEVSTLLQIWRRELGIV